MFCDIHNNEKIKKIHESTRDRYENGKIHTPV